MHFRSQSAERSGFRGLVEWVVVIAAALIAALIIKTFVLQAFYIPSASMERTLNIRDRVLVNKLSYRLHDINRGDIVVFERPPGQEGDPEIKDLIKRVIGLPGETVESRDGSIYIDGKRLREPYLQPNTPTTGVDPYEIPLGHYWVMGDNRTKSKDSRYFKAIPESLVVGRAFIRVWPVNALGML